MAKVQALKSFEFQGEIKHPWSRPFDIRDSDVAQFKALRLVDVLTDSEVKTELEQHQSAQPEVGQEQSQDAPRRGRRPGQK